MCDGVCMWLFGVDRFYFWIILVLFATKKKTNFFGCVNNHKRLNQIQTDSSSNEEKKKEVKKTERTNEKPISKNQKFENKQQRFNHTQTCTKCLAIFGC